MQLGMIGLGRASSDFPADRFIPVPIRDVVWRAYVVGGDQVQARRVHHDLERGPADSSRSVDGDPGHGEIEFLRWRRQVLDEGESSEVDLIRVGMRYWAQRIQRSRRREAVREIRHVVRSLAAIETSRIDDIARQMLLKRLDGVASEPRHAPEDVGAAR